jgi:hypothetical protein
MKSDSAQAGARTIACNRSGGFRTMPGLALSLKVVEVVALACAGAAVGLAAIFGYRAWKRSRVSPAERERRRRNALVARGKITDATLVEIQDTVLVYTYLVRGVEYTASQDVASLGAHMPSGMGLGVGPVSVRYSSGNPANSIVLDENWSGLRGPKP